MANFFKEYMLTPSLLDKFSNIGNKISSGLSTAGDKVKTGFENAQNRYDNLSDSQKGFVNSLLNTGIKQLQPSGQYELTPSRVDYSQYMGISPETQRYFYRGL